MSPTLVDTTVWRDFFAGRPRAHPLGGLLEEDHAVVLHTTVLGELALGGLAAREHALLELLPRVAEVTSDEVLALVRARRLARRGVGWVDCHLLASALCSSVRVWTFDARLHAVAAELGVAATLAHRHL